MIAATFFYCILSALIPLFNAEVYVSGVAAGIDSASEGVMLWLLAGAAAAGQMIGKLAYFLLGRSSLNWRWVRKKTESERWQAALARWQRRIGGRPWLAGAVLLGSAFAGFPPFAVLSVIAGQLRVALPLFLTVGFVGRTARFAAVLGLVGFLADLA